MNSRVAYLLELAVEYIQREDFGGADRLLTQALKMAPKSSEIYRLLGINFAFKKNHQEALKMLERSIKIEPNNWVAYSNQGNVLRDLNKFDLALKSYDRALKLNPNYAEAFNNRGNLLQSLKKFDLALENYDRAIALQPNYADAYSNAANALKKLNLFNLALAAYEKAIFFGGNGELILSSYLDCKMKLCDWSGIEESIEKINQGKIAYKDKFHPFCLLSICADPFFIGQVTREYMRSEHPIKDNLGEVRRYVGRQRIRLGYFSPDFRNHAVSFLIAGMIEEHDRGKFELIAFSMGPSGKGDEMRARLQNSFDSFIDISEMSDLEVAQKSRDLEIDIAIDLGGLTQDARPSIFAYRAAPIQIGYIGYLGTFAAPYMDYIIADNILIPKELQTAYSEKVIYLPSYQANDCRRLISDRVFNREELGLPGEGFVYCCFNNNYKITPSIFDSWARILHAVEKSVLLLYAVNDEVKKNLITEMRVRSVDVDRIFFAGHLTRDEYLARYRVADLFLDTSPYNAGTTASDALWAGLPILTYLGRSFSARICASILTAVGLPELVASSQQDYEELAISIGKNPLIIATLKNKLAENKLTTPLFNTKLFTQNLELMYTKAYERDQLGLPPDHIY